MPRFAASELGLHCLHLYPKLDFSLKRDDSSKRTSCVRLGMKPIRAGYGRLLSRFLIISYSFNFHYHYDRDSNQSLRQTI